MRPQVLRTAGLSCCIMAYARGPLGGKRFRNYQNASSRDGAFYGEPVDFPNFTSRRGTKYSAARYSRGGSVHSGTHSDLRYSNNFNGKCVCCGSAL